ncbi:Non-heme dioxygenase N-terminal domain containing protein [Parasponia andersonii]|uniref:Non-heme dioxygenase N-terminal domain containing protein n=1 Tax=Parasponia andersonii TaxID=3476 RepID=A0A2P5C8G7_PARAD|nr:Non-heme dioxygenase N-terminal domain containing protein [Parasponia andersonii]
MIEQGHRDYRPSLLHGCFQITNHWVPLGLMSQAFDLSKEFSGYPDEEKLKSSPESSAPLPAGNRQPEHSLDKTEYLSMFTPDPNVNVFNKTHLRGVLEDVFLKIGLLWESIVKAYSGYSGLRIRD